MPTSQVLPQANINMKIALTHMRHATTGGTERFLNQISSALARRGHDVTIICRTHAEANHPDIKFVALRGWAIGRGHRLWRFAKDVEKFLANNKFDLVFALGRTWTQDVVRVGGGLYRDQIGQGLGKQRFWPRDLVAMAIERKTFAPGNYRMVIANSYLTERSIIDEYQVPAESITTIHNAVDTERFVDNIRSTQGKDLRQTCGFSDEHRVYLFLGSGYRRKGLDRLLHAFALVHEQNPASRLIVVGNDSSQRDYEKLAAQLQIADMVCFLGKRNDAEVCYNAADIYVMPTRFDAFGYSAIEALACGLPVVITDSAGAAEVMEENVSQIVRATEPEMPRALADAMLGMTRDARDPGMRADARKLAAEYSETKVISKVVALLEQQAQSL
jgi:UDP-glucose:(heptosyl)LPS alpha-1,3-glucosyltransferase